MKVRTSVLALSVVMAMVPSVVSSVGSIGSQVSGFGSSGTVVTNLDATGPGYSDVPARVISTENGFFVIGSQGTANASTVAIASYDKDGVLHANFGSDGIATAPQEDDGVVVSDAALVSDGIVAVGTLTNAGQTYGIVYKFTEQGALDTSFGEFESGVDTYSDGDAETFSAVEVTSDGKLVIAGTAEVDGERQPIVYRLLPDGSIDSTFGDSGVVSLRAVVPETTEGTTAINDIALQSDGKVVLAGYVEQYPDPSPSARPRFALLMRINGDGTLDESFASAGVFAYRPPDGQASGYIGINAITLQGADEKILAAGYGASSSLQSTIAVLLRVTSDGLLDPALGSSSAKVFLTQGNSFTDVTLDEGGRIIASGKKTIGQSGADVTDSFVARYSPGGVADPTFSEDGLAVFDIGNDDEALSVAMNSNGEILVAGSVEDGTDDWYITKLGSDTQLMSTVSDHAPRPGSSVELSYPADTFEAGESVAIALVTLEAVSKTTSLGSLTAADDGSASGSVTIPADAIMVPSSLVASGQTSATSVTTPITVAVDKGSNATDIDYARPGQYDVEPCASETDTDCIESTGYYTTDGEFVSAGFLQNNDPSGYVCADDHVNDHSGSMWNFPGLTNEVGNSILLVGPMIKTPNFNHNCTRAATRDTANGLVAEQVYVSFYAGILTEQGYNQMTVAEPRTDCPEPSNDNPHTAESCQRRAGPGGSELIEITMRVSGFAPAFAYTSTRDTEVIIEPMDDGGSRVTLRGRANGVPGVWDTSSFDQGSLQTADQADYIEQMWSFFMANANTANFPTECNAYGFPVVAGNHAWGGQPSWDSQAEELVFNMGAPHLRPDGEPFEGQYEARIPLEYARCLWGIDPESLITSLEVIVEDEGVERDPTEFDASITIVDDMLHIDAEGFHFSEPDVIVRTSGGSFTPLTPKRLLDTRSGDKVGELDGSGAAYELQVTGAGGVPSSGVSAVALNVTAVSTETNDFGGFVTVYPCGTRPDASNLNFTSGMTIPNSVIAPVSSSGKVCFYVYGKAHLLADVSGYFPR